MGAIKVQVGPRSSEDCRGESARCLSSGFSWRPVLTFLGLQQHHTNSASIIVICLCFSESLFPYKVKPVRSFLTLITPAKYFPTSSPSQLLGVRTSTFVLGQHDSTMMDIITEREQHLFTYTFLGSKSAEVSVSLLTIQTKLCPYCASA